MYGMVNRAFEEMITADHGAATWQAVKERSSIDVREFNAMTQYPDAVTVQLLGAASEVLGRAPSDLLVALGEYWILYTAKAGYGDLLKLAGGSFASFLQNLDNMHARVGLSFPDLMPPSFRCTDVTADSLTFHYYSGRAGLTDLVVGLVRGLGRLFALDVSITVAARKGEGSDHDVFHIRYAER
jgi:phage tail protein X